MYYDAFDYGVEPGGLRNKSEIRLLICYILANIDTPLTKDGLINSLQKRGLVNYFEGASAFEDLLRNKNIELADVGDESVEGDERYVITDSGRMIARQLDDDLPITVRESALESTLQLIAQEKVEKENTVKVQKLDNGFSVQCAISGGEMNLLSFDLYVPESSQTRIVKNNFQSNPEMIYNVMVAMLTRDFGMVEEALEEVRKKAKRTDSSPKSK